MAYQINKTDGTIVATVADGQIDTLSTDLTLIGKNYSGFGESLNENFIKLLENFSSTARPTHPVRGQIWFDVSELKLKVYSGTEFLPVSSATIANTQPTSLGVGDLWFNNVDKQLYFFDGTSPILLGPSYSASQGLSGLKVASILDTLNQTRVVTYLYNNGILLGIFAKDSFTPKNAINGFTGNIIPGFNAGSLSGIKFNVTCTNSEKLNNVPALNYVRTDTDNDINGQVRITTDLGLVFGSANQGNLLVNNGNVFLSNAAAEKDLTLNVRTGANQEDAIKISATTRTINLYAGAPEFIDSQINVGGNLTVNGNLTVEGTTTTVNSTILEVADVNIVLAKGNTDLTGAGARNGGLILEGGSVTGSGDPAVFMWSDVNQTALESGYIPLKSSAWNSSESINLASGKRIYIGGIEVINGNSLGSAITAIPGVTSFGKQNQVTVGPGLIDDPAYLKLENNRLSSLQADQDIEIEPQGVGNISLIGSPRIVGLQDPVDEQDASTKEYVDNRLESRPLVFSIDLSDGKPNSYIISNILNNLAPPLEFRNGTIARVLCNLISNNTVDLDLNPLVSQSTATFNTPTGTAPAVTNVGLSPASINGPSVNTTRIVKIFQLSGPSGAYTWGWISDTLLPP